MPRKKTGKQGAKRLGGRGQSATMQRIEKDFRATPNLLTSQLSKEIKTLRAQEKKLKGSSSKLKSKLKSSESRFKKASSSKNSPTGKKQYLAAKKMHDTHLKSQTALEKQLKENAGLLQSATARQAKFAALKKHLAQFEKDWAKNSKKTQAKTTTRAKSKKRRQTASTFDRNQTERQQPQDNYESMNEEVRLDETEVTS